MEEIVVFFCDIYGTFDSGSEIYVNYNQLMRFVNNLDFLIRIHGSNKLIFSFVTTENEDIVLSMEQKLRDNISNVNIDIGTHFCCDDNHLNVDKPLEILNYIKLLEQDYIINQVYYADDCEFYHYLLSELKTFYDINCCFQSIIPKRYGLFEVNDILDDILLSHEKKQKFKSIH